MSEQITDLGNGLGYIYVTETNGTSVVKTFNNDKTGVRDVKSYGISGAATALNRKAWATITVDTVTGAGQINSIITASGINVIDPATPITYTGATTTSALASLVSAAINSYIDLSAPSEECTAIADSGVVYVYLNEGAGSTLNNTSLTVTDTGNMTNTVTPFEGGSDNTKLYDEAYGYRFFLNADYDASGCSGLGTAPDGSVTGAWEITSYIIPRYLNSAKQVSDTTISSGVIYVERESSDILIYVETESFAATDDLDSIRAEGYAEGDKITIVGNNSGRVTTVKDGIGNISLESGDFDTDGFSRALVLELKDSTWYEVSRSNEAIGSMADYRTAGYGFFGVDTYNSVAVATTGTISFTGGADKKWQKLTGTSTLVANTFYQLAAPGAVDGDEFWLEYDASVTVGAFSLSIFGITLTTEQALTGGLIFRGKFMDGAWRTYVMPNMNTGATYPFQINSGDVAAGAITPAKVGGGMEVDLITSQISWDTNRLGDHKVVIPFDCTVNQIDVYADDLIEATDDADVNFKNNAGLSMGTLTLTGGDTIGAGYSDTPSTNNTFTAGQVLTMTTTKSTAGGNAKVSLKVTKT